MRKQIELTCYHCGKKFSRAIAQRKQALREGRTKPYCSKECANKEQNTRITVKCYCCGKRVKKQYRDIKGSKTNRFFCSHTCAAKVTKNSRINNLRTTYRKTAFDNLKGECCLCGYNIKEALIAHHKDYNRENNDISNLCIVCWNCHVLIHRGIIAA